MDGSVVTGGYYVSISAPHHRNPDDVYSLRVFTDDYPADITTTAEYGTDTLRVYLMRRSRGTHIDWVTIEPCGGSVYQFTFYIGWAANTAVINGIYDSTGTIVPGQDAAVENPSWVTRIFTAPTNGFYYIALSGKGPTTRSGGRS